MKQFLRLEEIKLTLAEDESILESKIIRILWVQKQDISSFVVVKKSIDSREKNNILFVYSVDIDLKTRNINLQKPILLKHKAKYVDEYVYEIPIVPPHINRMRPIVIGTGPAGLFAWLALAKAGLNPIIIERGKAVEGRLVDVGMFMKGWSLNTESNIQFGEGGAGTFSDGKLYTMINDPRSKYVFEEMVAAWAPAEIMYTAKAHVGTDKLRILVRELRKKIIALGADIRFSTCMTDMEIVDGKLVAIIVNWDERIECDTLILAIGHSARDTYEMLLTKWLNIVQKPFSMGVRIEHDATMINRSQFWDACVSPKLWTASYKLVSHNEDVRTLYSFCMCPGGHVVAASSEHWRLCVNGMSEYRQNSGISNSALMVPITPDDFASDHPLAWVEFQRYWEQKAFVLGGSDYHAPAQLVGDFLADRQSTQDNAPKTTYLPWIKMTNIQDCLPEFITAALKKWLIDLDKKIKWFASPDALLIAIEARSSAVIRINRDKETLQSNIAGIYPSGEGAGYAGGITSSAIDGLIVTERIIQNYLSK
jgi:uncharacterized FAD-dependent dehydrogenase